MFMNMMDEKQKTNVANRLSRVEGQVRGIRRMVEEDRYCMDILAQTRSITAALRKVENLIMETHLNTCVADAMRSTDERDQDEKVKEIMTVLADMRKHG